MATSPPARAAPNPGLPELQGSVTQTALSSIIRSKRPSVNLGAFFDLRRSAELKEIVVRQGLLALGLILAAFAGGAFVNGPGLDWMGDQVAQDRGELDVLDDELGEVAIVVDEPEPTVDESKPDQPMVESLDVSGIAQLPANLDRSVDSEASEDPSRLQPPDVPAPRGPSIVGELSTNPSGSSLAERVRARMNSRASADRSENLDANHPDREGTENEPRVPTSTVESSPRSDWPDAPDTLAPPTAVVPQHQPETGRRDTKVQLASNEEPVSTEMRSTSIARPQPVQDLGWAAIRNELDAFGVRRFWIEGNLTGEVRFRCLVPVLGDQVVSQHFEAEGPTVIEAASIALRRIALWRATEEVLPEDSPIQ